MISITTAECYGTKYCYDNPKKPSAMPKSAQPSLSIKKNILFFALINLAVYVALFFIFRAIGLLHLSGLRMLNYITLGFVCCYQIDRWVKKGGVHESFLQAFLIAFVTGSVSFVFFAAFIFIYSLTDPYFMSLYFNNSDGTIKMAPFIIIFFEGSAGSIIVGLVAAMYSEKYKDKTRL
jgi:hypothetical protein